VAARLPARGGDLGAFVIYEVYRSTHTSSVLLPFLAVLDMAVIVVTLLCVVKWFWVFSGFVWFRGGRRGAAQCAGPSLPGQGRIRRR
jgi:hypothetical protein